MIRVKRPSGPAIKRLHLDGFRKKFAYNDRRKSLVERFIEEMECVKSQCTKLRVLIYGSYLTSKKNPGDIDVFISLIPDKDCVFKIITDGLRRVHPEEVDIQFHKTQYFIQDAEKMMKYFNENEINKKNGVVMRKAVEIVDI
jgi:hypothetical protein